MAATEVNDARDKVLLRDAGALLVISSYGEIIWHESEVAEGTLVWRPTDTGGTLVLRGARLRKEVGEMTRDVYRDVQILHVTHTPPAFVRGLEEGDVAGAVDHLLEEIKKQTQRPQPHPLRLFLRRIRFYVRRTFRVDGSRPPRSYGPPVVVARVPIEEGEEATSTSVEEHSMLPPNP